MSSPNHSADQTGLLKATKSQKAKRKISLPWFRQQGSISQHHPGLSRQHTIDTPGSFQARLLRRQPSRDPMAGVLEMTWVMSDFQATNSSELSVSKGQQVEVVEVCATKPDYCLVRMPTRGSDQETVPEGLVPLAVLKQPPVNRGSPSRKPPAVNLENDSESVPPNDQSATANTTSSPVNKRRGLIGRKWLPPPLRKLSQGKVEKNQTPPPLDTRPPLKKTGSDKRIKVPSASDMGNTKSSVSEGEEDDDRPLTSHSSHPALKGAKSAEISTNGGSNATEDIDEDEKFELPPAMKPINEPKPLVTSPPPGVPDIDENPCKRVSSLTIKSLEGAATADLAEIEQIVKERMDHHSEVTGAAYSTNRSTKSSDELSIDPGSSNDTTSYGGTSALSGDESDRQSDISSRAKYLKHRNMVINELLETEEQYVRDLSLVVEGYIANMRDPMCEISQPECLSDGMDKIIFGNIEAIYEWHKTHFLKYIRECVDKPIQLAEQFTKVERRMAHLYNMYCQNKPMSEYILNNEMANETYFEELRTKLEHRLQLCDLLIKPVQRLTRYQILLGQILKYTEKAQIEEEIGPLRRACEVMSKVPKDANDMMEIGRLQGFEGQITKQGKLKQRGILIVSDLPGQSIVGKNKECEVFLFEQSLIFAEVIGRKKDFVSPQYIYKAHLLVNKISMETKEDRFILNSNDPTRIIKGFDIQAPSNEKHTSYLREWIKNIQGILDLNLDWVRRMQNPLKYQTDQSNKEALFPWDTPSTPTTPTSTSQEAPSFSATPNSKQNTPKKSGLPIHKAKTTGLPSPHENGGMSNDGHSGRKSAIPIHKANTIGIPSESDLVDHSNPATPRKRTLFDGFRNPLRNKHKSDSAVIDSGKEGEKNDLHKRWSEHNGPNSENHILAPGTQARIIREYPNVNLGEVVTIVRYDANQGYLVNVNVVNEEIWLPSTVLSTTNNRKPNHWNFGFKKPPRRNFENSSLVENPGEGSIPEFLEKLKDIAVPTGSNVVFKCKVKCKGQNVRHKWKKLEPNLCVLRNGRFSINDNDEGVAGLSLDNVKPIDSGTYMFTIANEFGSTSCSARLTVNNTTAPLFEPTVQVTSSSGVQVDWDNPNHNQFLVEYCKLGSGEWLSPNNNHTVTTSSYTVEDLIPGETYSFRIIAAQHRQVSLPSAAVTLPIGDNLRWQQEQFKRRYLELEEINRGRFSIVRLAKDRGTKMEVALKQISRRKQSHLVTEAEYALLAKMEHENIIRAMAMFDNAPVPGVDTIVLELVKGPLLFDYLCENDTYLESTVKLYTKQLMAALNWLHQKNLAHLDVKPENIMVDLSHSPPLLKLVDFGDSVNTQTNVILPPACLEFASPELVLGQPVGKHTDLWAAGVFLYVLLSGVSPFLDDSLEETTANILKCDFCFPDEYFCEISEDAKQLVKNLLILLPSPRMNMENCLERSWFSEQTEGQALIPSSRLKTFMQRRRPNVPTTPTSPKYTGTQII